MPPPVPPAPPTAPPPPSPAAADDRLARLEKLHESGALTDEEFLAQRRRILGG
jgi:Short C-terminal domain